MLLGQDENAPICSSHNYILSRAILERESTQFPLILQLLMSEHINSLLNVHNYIKTIQTDFLPLSDEGLYTLSLAILERESAIPPYL